MAPTLSGLLVRLTRVRPSRGEAPPLLVELFDRAERLSQESPESYPFKYEVTVAAGVPVYRVTVDLSPDLVLALRRVVQAISYDLDPDEVRPLEFKRLVEVLRLKGASEVSRQGIRSKVKELSELCAFEAIGMSRTLALSLDKNVSEFFVDSDLSPVYLDHAVAGRCETGIMLTERERQAYETHLDTFGGYTPDFRNPSLVNDLRFSEDILRVSLDLPPLAVNRFALDVRRLSSSALPLRKLIELGVISIEAASYIVGWLESGGNVAIVGETGTGKTTLLNALDAEVERRLRRLYIEDAVETRDLLDQGYHQAKVKVDPLDRGTEAVRTKQSEIVKALHRSPDIVILSEVQSEEHSRALFQALAAGARGLQTFHASTIEQAMSRWQNMHHIGMQSLVDLGLLVQMSRPNKLLPKRVVQRVCVVVEVDGSAASKEVFGRSEGPLLARAGHQGVLPPTAPGGGSFARIVESARQRLQVDHPRRE
ncbi:MAG TPA: ATPase, T2SS/T4P/T4SS family [Nitrososphaerales archaeon]|nr:ATPase, T2SS/T4P/T4SS family [Nitrososphaerales archaeon]